MKIFFFSSTHWDREWYQPFQGFRRRLVDILKSAVDHLENHPEFAVFHLDGQTVVLEDAYAIMPELRPRVENLLKQKRLLIGPWFVMPDEFLVSGEALIQNLLRGSRIAAEHGVEPWRFGYLCDTFGHIAQMPQILKGFNIDYALLGRGTNTHTTDPFFLWESPDGSSLITIKVPDEEGYCGLSIAAIGFDNKGVDDKTWKEKIVPYINREKAKAKLPLLCIMDAGDHAALHTRTPDYLQLTQELFPDDTFVHADLRELGRELEPYRSQLHKKCGELIEPGKMHNAPYLYLITHTLSSRITLKQANDTIQNLLERDVSSIESIMHLQGKALHRNYSKLAWDYLLKNHPHDSICGCSIDQVHQDMKYRFDQSRLLAEEIIIAAIESDCAENRSTPNTDNAELTIQLFNPLPYERKEVHSIIVDFPVAYPSRYFNYFGYDEVNSFTLHDTSSHSVPYTITSVDRQTTTRDTAQTTKKVDRYTLTAPLHLKPTSWNALTVKHSKTPQRHRGSQQTALYSANNGKIGVTILPDGSFNLTDLRSGRTYIGCNRFIADSDIGDGWNHENLRGERKVTGGECLSIECCEDSPFRTAYSITQKLLVPECIRALKQSKETADIFITTELTLDSGDTLLGVKITVKNSAKDWRLRLRVPTMIRGNYIAAQSFALINRGEGMLFGNTDDWKECEVLEKNCANFAGKIDDKGGLVFISSAGIHEVAASTEDDAPLYFTLLRSVGRTVMTNGETDGYLLGTLSYDTALYCSAPGEPITTAYRRAQCFSTKPRSYTTAGIKASSHPLMTLNDDRLAISTIKIPEDESPNTLIVRLFNISHEMVNSQLTFSRPLKQIQYTRLDESVTTEVEIDKSGRGCNIQCKKGEIITLRVNFISVYF